VEINPEMVVNGLCREGQEKRDKHWNNLLSLRHLKKQG